MQYKKFSSEIVGVAGSLLCPLEKVKFQFVLSRTPLILKWSTFILVSSGLAMQVFSKRNSGENSLTLFDLGDYLLIFYGAATTPQCLIKIAPYHLWEESSSQKSGPFGTGH